MKIREQTGPAMRTIGSTRIAAELARSVALDGVVGDRWQKLRLIATVVLLLFVPLGVSADRSTTIIVPGSVTASVLEAKIAEIEVAPELPEADKADLLSLYRKALSNLQAAASSSEAAQAFEQTQQTAPDETQAIRQQMEESRAVAPEDTLEATPATPLTELEALLQKEKADLAAVDARRADFAKRLQEEAGRPALIRQRLTEAKDQQEQAAAQLRLQSRADEGQTKAEARRWVLETQYEALSAEIQMLDQELLSQPARLDLLQAKHDKAAASVIWIGARVKVLEDLANQSRQAEAESAKQTAKATRREAEGQASAGGATRRAERRVDRGGRRRRLRAGRLDGADGEHRQPGTPARCRLQERQRVDLDRDLRPERGARLLSASNSVNRCLTCGRSGGRRGSGTRRRESRGAALASPTRAETTSAIPRAMSTGFWTRRPRGGARSARSADGSGQWNARRCWRRPSRLTRLYLRRLGELETAQQRLLQTIERFDEFLDVHLLVGAQRFPLAAPGAGSSPRRSLANALTESAGPVRRARSCLIRRRIPPRSSSLPLRSAHCCGAERT